MKLPIVVVPGLARNLFSVPQAASQGVVTTFVADASRTETDSFVLPLKQVRGTRDLYSFDLELDTPGLVLQVTRIHTANNRHRRVGHVNAKSLDLLNKADGNGMCFVREVSDCDVCAIGNTPVAPNELTRRKPASMSAILLGWSTPTSWDLFHLQRWEASNM